MEKKRWFVGIKDKIDVSSEKCCPPHYWPHKLPFGEKLMMNHATYTKQSGEWRTIDFIAKL